MHRLTAALLPALLWTAVTLLLWSNNADFNRRYALNLTSLSTVAEADARAQFGAASPYEDQLFIHTPIVTWLFRNVLGAERAVPLFVGIAVLSKLLLSRALGLTLVGDLLFSLLFFGNPFLYQQVVQTDTRLFDLLLIGLLLNVNKRSVWGSAAVLALMSYLRTQNVILLASLTGLTHKQFAKVVVLTVVSVAALLAVSARLAGGWVS